MEFTSKIHKTIKKRNFFQGWKTPPNGDQFMSILENSEHKIFALDERKNIIGFICAITDHNFSAFVTNLEVLPEYQNRGIGSKLVEQLKSELEGFYSIDLVCDRSVVSFYKKSGFKETIGMSIRNYDHAA